jgi:hypothetical protein
MSEFCMKCYEGIFPHADCRAKSSTPTPSDEVEKKLAEELGFKVAGCHCGTRRPKKRSEFFCTEKPGHTGNHKCKRKWKGACRVADSPPRQRKG